jgi:hypothetical protein
MLMLMLCVVYGYMVAVCVDARRGPDRTLGAWLRAGGVVRDGWRCCRLSRIFGGIYKYLGLAGAGWLTAVAGFLGKVSRESRLGWLVEWMLLGSFCVWDFRHPPLAILASGFFSSKRSSASNMHLWLWCWLVCCYTLACRVALFAVNN